MRVKEDVERKRPDRCPTLDFLLHHDDAPSLTAWSVKQFLIENNWTAVPYPALIPDLDLSVLKCIKLKGENSRISYRLQPKRKQFRTAS